MKPCHRACESIGQSLDVPVGMEGLGKKGKEIAKFEEMESDYIYVLF